MTSSAIIFVLCPRGDLVRELRREFLGKQTEIVTYDSLVRMCEAARSRRPDLMLVQLTSAGASCVDLFALLRAEPATAAIPVILTLAEDENAQYLQSLELGAEDALREPLCPRELAARMRAALRRRPVANWIATRVAAMAARQALADQFICGRLTIDIGRKEAIFAGRRVDLTAMQFRILELLAFNGGRVLSREHISASVRGDATALDRGVDAHIKAIRRKLGDWQCIQTVRGFGYRLVEQPIPTGHELSSAA
jgi:DNA-binding response OmpR family regulator